MIDSFTLNIFSTLRLTLEEQRMLHKLSTALISAAFIFTATTANAHSPEMHKKENTEKPNCEGMQNMDHSTMDINDPIMQAMMKQCMSGEGHRENHGEGNQGTKNKKMEKNHGGEHKKDGHHS